jgi:hypothetical protein
MALYATLLAQAWNLLGGYGGQFSFGHALFFGTGAYAMAIAQLSGGLNAWVALGLAAPQALPARLEPEPAGPAAHGDAPRPSQAAARTRPPRRGPCGSPSRTGSAARRTRGTPRWAACWWRRQRLWRARSDSGRGQACAAARARAPPARARGWQTPT